MTRRRRLFTGLTLGLAALISVGLAACGGGSQGPISARVIVTDAQVSQDGQRVESITIQAESGEELSLRLGQQINLSDWSPQHFQSHVGLGKNVGLGILVTYVETAEGKTVIELAE